jgi:hypothetical protein
VLIYSIIVNGLQDESNLLRVITHTELSDNRMGGRNSEDEEVFVHHLMIRQIIVPLPMGTKKAALLRCGLFYI